MQETRTQTPTITVNKQVLKKERVEGMAIRNFKSLSRKGMYSPAMVTANSNNNNPDVNKDKENQSKLTNNSTLNSNNTNKENIGDNTGGNNDQESGNKGKEKIGYRYLHGRAGSNFNNRSNSRARRETNKQNENKDQEIGKEKEKKSISVLENSPIPNLYKQISNQKAKNNTKQQEPPTNINMFRSPTKQEPYTGIINGNLIYESVSKDGQYRVTSRCLNHDELKEASDLEHNINLKSKKQSMKELLENGYSQGHSHSSAHRPHGQLHSNSSPKASKYVLDPSKVSSKENGNIKAYAVNSNQGISRKYNEDRVSIILNIMKNGVKASYFAIYDGHGGANCCDFLTQNLHQFVFNSKYFPTHPRQALIEGMKLAESKFIEATKALFLQKKQIDRSGSCAIILLIIGDDCYIANLGDSRAILSTCLGKPMYSLSRDHKPTDTGEQARILKEGGKIYRTEMVKIKKQNPDEGNKKQNEIIIGPLRVYPGKLSVTRTFGDIEAKDPELGGIKNCISTDPQICKYTLTGKQDFIILGCDGLFQKLDSQQVIEQAWKSIKRNQKGDIHEAVGAATQSIVKLCMDRKGTDNITAIMVCLGSLGLETSLTDYASV